MRRRVTFKDSLKKQNDIFYKIIGEQQVRALASAIGEHNIEYLKLDFYCLYAKVMEFEDKGLIKVDIARLWDEYASKRLLADVLPNMLVSQTCICQAENGFEQIIERFRPFKSDNTKLHMVKFKKKSTDGTFHIGIINPIKKLKNFSAMDVNEPFRISFFSESANSFKKPDQPVSAEEVGIVFVHERIVSQNPTLVQGETK